MEIEIKHGSSSGYKRCSKRPEKTCDVCKAYNRSTAQARLEVARKLLQEDPDSFKHGTIYVFKLGCICKPCKEIGTKKSREYWANRQGIPVPENAHGTTRGYNYYKCRCDDCKWAWSFYRALRKSSAAEKKRLVLQEAS